MGGDGQFPLTTTRVFSLLILVVLPMGLMLALYSYDHGKPTPFFAIQTRINPNHATLPELMSLPGIGRARAEAILAYRRNQASAGRSPVFRSAQELTAVSGLGPVTVQRLVPYLTFEP